MQTRPDANEQWHETAAALPQLAPEVGSTEVYKLVLADLTARKWMGIAKYGTPLMVENGRDHLMDLYQELLDAVMYIRAEIEKRRQGQG